MPGCSVTNQYEFWNLYTTFFANMRHSASPSSPFTGSDIQIAAHNRTDKRWLWTSGWSPTMVELQQSDVRTPAGRRGSTSSCTFTEFSNYMNYCIFSDPIFDFFFSSSAIKKPTSNTVPGRCGTLRRWFAVCRSARRSVSLVSCSRRAQFRCVIRFWKRRRWPLPSRTLSLRRICGSVRSASALYCLKLILIDILNSTAESFCTKGKVFKGVRRHARARVGKVEYFHCHYFLRLEEGSPPADYYGRQKTPEQQLDEWMEGMRKRKIIGTL